ncbi:uncharacterized protein EV422DRAFT_562883 [Fimicolochytrium jonesii]|uniref:uncharacterized protein n=1 Tax=Fimicolochytrium jonesii TaxID=1396493 RepID=UPI0022FDDAB8|nr:uncharacterized protein EV422DRAFT_562883 [Fimicolochytrium jonesii]KAI8826826.1 hypothetical protein EV422DRAFT_562883 [Fimicolochytrium jonesii]
MLRQLISQASVCRASIGIRHYATATARPPPITTLNGVLPLPTARAILSNPKRTRRGNPLDLRRLYFYAQYAEIISSRAVFIMQNHNLTSPEYFNLKTTFKEKGFIVTTVRNDVFSAAIRKHAKGVNKQLGRDSGLGGLRQLCAGPVCVAFSNAVDSERPHLARDFAELVKPFSKKGKLMVVGAKFDGQLLTSDTLETVVKLPALGELRAELVGLLGMPSMALVEVLGRIPQHLLSSLGEHVRVMEEAAGDKGAQEPTKEK